MMIYILPNKVYCDRRHIVDMQFSSSFCTDICPVKTRCANKFKVGLLTVKIRKRVSMACL